MTDIDIYMIQHQLIPSDTDTDFILVIHFS